MAHTEHTAPDPNHYYVPHGSHWPIIGSFGLLGTVGGAGLWLNEANIGKPIMAVGVALILFMMFGWFGTVIRESLKGYYNKQVDTSFRMGMMWFIFSEVMFFAAFFGALFYARSLSVLLIALVMLGIWTGIIRPHGMGG
jgi:cytochrome c oxidase subunit 3